MSEGWLGFVACGLRLAKGWPPLVQSLPVAVSLHPRHMTHWNICPLHVRACVCLYTRVDVCVCLLVYTCVHAGITAAYWVPWEVVYDPKAPQLKMITTYYLLVVCACVCVDTCFHSH